MQDPDDPHINLDPAPAELVEHAIRRQQAYLSASGVLCAASGGRQGPAGEDRYIVQEGSTREAIAWEGVQPFTDDDFDDLWERVEEAIAGQEHFQLNLEVGSDADYALPLQLITTSAWHALLATNLYLRPALFNVKGKALWQVLHVPEFICVPERDGTHSDGAAIIHFAQRKILLAGLRSASELSRALLTVQSFLLPDKDAIALPAAAVVNADKQLHLFLGQDAALHALACKHARLVSGNSIGWAREGIFALEAGGTLGARALSSGVGSKVPAAFTSVAENMVHNEQTRIADFRAVLPGQPGQLSFAAPNQPLKTLAPVSITLLCHDDSDALPAFFRIDNGGLARLIMAAKAHIETGLRPENQYRKLLQKRLDEFAGAAFVINTAMLAPPKVAALCSAVSQGAAASISFNSYAPLELLGAELPSAIPGLEGVAVLSELAQKSPKEAAQKAEKFIAKLE